MVLEGEEGWMRKMRDLGALRSGALHSSNRQAAGGHWGRLGGRATEGGGQNLVLRGQAHYRTTVQRASETLRRSFSAVVPDQCPNMYVGPVR